MTTSPRGVATSVAAAAVVPLVPTRSFDDSLTYSIEESIVSDITVGTIVEIPLGSARRVGVVVETGVQPPAGVTLKPISRVVDLPAVPAVMLDLASWIARQYGCARTVAMALVVHPRLAAQARATAVPHRQQQQAVRRAVDEVSGIDLTKRQLEIARAVPQSWASVAETCERLGTTRQTLAKLSDAGVLTIEERFIDEIADSSSSGTAEAADQDQPSDAVAASQVSLTDTQLRAATVCMTAPANAPATVLMGETGSGKTEVYLEVIQASLDEGRGAIVLVPEISLTPQTARRFTNRFGSRVEVLHSGMTKVQRGDAYERISAGSSTVIVGPRSAVFAPIADLGVIVIDEEHDSSYKQDSEPRYDARRVAYRRAQLQGAQLIYGSATPRPETWQGIDRHVRMTERPGGGRLAPVELVDVRDFSDDQLPLTDPVLDAIEACLRRGRKAIILQNRRGFANALHCRTCGHTVRCPRCDVSLVVHGRVQSRQRLACHHCGYSARPTQSCTKCGANEIVTLGAGTQQVESILTEKFDTTLFRLDADTARSRGGVSEILADFQAAGPSLLVGTQMVAKGHDFPDVELAVVVDADAALAIPDFRAEERAFSLVAQLAGRAGRSPQTAEHAKVMVQTYDPSQPFLAYAKEHDVDGFLTRELERRREVEYPPFTRLVRVLVSSRRAAERDVWAAAVAEGMIKLNAGRVLGPAQLLRINDRERAQVLIKTNSPAAVADALRRFITRTERDRNKVGVRMMLDVDPQSLL